MVELARVAAASLALFASLGTAGERQSDYSAALLEAFSAELARSMEVLGDEVPAPYFLSYEATETEDAYATAAFGALMDSGESRHRQLDVDLRVGDYDLDNTRQLRGSDDSPRSFYTRLPLDDDVDAIRAALWEQTDAAYKHAAEQFTKIKTDLQVKVDAEDQSADFSRERPHKHRGAVARLAVDMAEWEAKARRYSAPFGAAGFNILQGTVEFSAEAETRYIVTSEGTEVVTGETRYRLTIDAAARAEDGMILPRYESFMAFDEAGLPKDEVVHATVRRMIADLAALKEAPVVAPYAGPAILSGRAAGVFFHEILGHRVEGHRQKRVEDGQTFKKKIGERILPPAFAIAFDPGRRAMAGTDLAGAYRYDNEGQPGQRVMVVENGVLKRFLMSRIPIDGFPRTNGHGRKEHGNRPVARQSNLIVEVAQPLGRDEMRGELIKMVTDEDKPFGLYFDDIQGGFTTTGRLRPNAFNVQPILVYRVYRDGREELVRGVDIIGTPLTTLSRIVAANDDVRVFNGYCGAESGDVPVAAVSPGVLVSQVEVQKQATSQERGPLLPPPVGEQTAAGASDGAEPLSSIGLQR